MDNGLVNPKERQKTPKDASRLSWPGIILFPTNALNQEAKARMSYIVAIMLKNILPWEASMNPSDPLIQGILKTCRQNLKQSQQLMPVFFIGNEDNIGIIGAEFDDPKSKDVCAAFIRKTAEEKKAEFILFIAESWTIRDQAAAKEYMDDMEAYDYSMGNHPGAVEVVMFSLETKTKCWTAMAEIKNREIGEIEWSETGRLEGRFSNFLGEKPTLN